MCLVFFDCGIECSGTFYDQEHDSAKAKECRESIFRIKHSGWKQESRRVTECSVTFLLFYEYISNILFLNMNAPDPSLAVRIDSDTKK